MLFCGSHIVATFVGVGRPTFQQKWTEGVCDMMKQLGDDDAADEACTFPEELTHFCLRRAALGLRVTPKARY